MVMMGKKGGSSHLKRLATPAFWQIHRKENIWAVNPASGSHSADMSIPLLVVVRDMLRLAETRREAEIIVAEGKVKVDGKTCKDEKFTIGLMDVLEISGLNQAFRVVPDTHHTLSLSSIGELDKTFKLCKIENKTILRGRKVQLNLHDGKNIIPKPEAASDYNVLDTVKIDLASKTAIDHLKFEEGMYAVISGGKNVGKHGVIVKIEKASVPRKQKTVKVKAADGSEFQTTVDKVFIVGKESPLIPLSRG